MAQEPLRTLQVCGDVPGGRWKRGEREEDGRKEREKTRRQKRPLQVVSVSVSRGREGGSRRRGRGSSSKATGQQSPAISPELPFGLF